MMDVNINWDSMRVLPEIFAVNQAYTKQFEESLSKIREILRPIVETTEEYRRILPKIKEGDKLAFQAFEIIDLLGEAQFVYWGKLSRAFSKELLVTSNVDETLTKYVDGNTFEGIDNVIKKTKENTIFAEYRDLYCETVQAFRQGLFDLAVIGFTVIFDGMLSVVSGLPEPKMSSRGKIVIEKMKKEENLDREDYMVLTFAKTFEKTFESFSENSDFSKAEPQKLNRHWIAHGRSHRKKTKLDCIKMMHFLYGLLVIEDLDKTTHQ